jgi:hypothetical protein
MKAEGSRILPLSSIRAPFALGRLMVISPPFKFVAIALAIALGACATADRTDAQQFKTDVTPSDPSAQNQTTPAPANSGLKITHSSVSLDKDSSSNIGHHHYNSDAERARDDLLITEVKSALAEDGISNSDPVEVDADHGTVTLSGVVASADDVQNAAEDAADVHGVVAVKNWLRPH